MSQQNTCTRWVGSLSLGLTLIAAGLVGLGCYFLPGFNGWLACRLSPAPVHQYRQGPSSDLVSMVNCKGMFSFQKAAHIATQHVPLRIVVHQVLVVLTE